MTQSNRLEFSQQHLQKSTYPFAMVQSQRSATLREKEERAKREKTIRFLAFLI
jgi:hypothetical protein